MRLACRCGAYDYTEAAVRQMGPTERIQMQEKVRNCRTCRLDRQKGAPGYD
jgi:hypothetical protein